MRTESDDQPNALEAKRFKKVPDARAALAISILILATAAFLLFTGLGDRPLWDDEALTAIPATNIWHKGAPYGVYHDNVTATLDGVELRNLKFCYMPPFQYYFVAPFVGILGDNAFAARFGFSLCGVGTIALLLAWLWRSRATYLSWILLLMALFGNVSFFLFCRQCRYFGLVLLLSTAWAYVYLHWGGRTVRLLALAALSIVLFATNYVAFAATYACALADYLCFAKREERLTLRQWIVLLAPQVLCAGPILLLGNPIGKDPSNFKSAHLIADRLTLLWWNFRDADVCEFAPGLLVLLIFVFAVVTSDRWLRRGCTALLIYILVVTVVSPQFVGGTSRAHVRYLIGIIPLAMALQTLTLQRIGRRNVWLALAIGFVAMSTNLLSVHALTNWADASRPKRPAEVAGIHSTPFDFVHELIAPPPDPYVMTAAWMNENMPHGTSVLVMPPEHNYPLMYLAPDVIYAWQLRQPVDPELQHLAPINYWSHAIPDYVVTFGTWTLHVRGVEFPPVAALPVFGRNMGRPELCDHSFYPMPFEAESMVYIRKTVAEAMVRPLPPAGK